MKEIEGKDFMFYIECETLTGSVTVPVCVAKNVSLQFQSEIREATKASESTWASFYYGKNSYSLSLDGLVTFSDDQITQLLISVNEQLLETNNQLVSVGGQVLEGMSPYFCFENALFDWKYLNWYCVDQAKEGYKYRGVVLVESLSNTWEPNAYREFSGSLRGDGKPERFHTPTPTELKKVGQSNTLPVEDANFTPITPTQQGTIWTSGSILTGTPLPNGKFEITIGFSTGLSYTVNPGDTLSEIASSLADAINVNPTGAGVLRAYSDDDTVFIESSTSKQIVTPYTAHTGTLRSVMLSFVSQPYDFYRIKVNDWIIDVTSNQPTIILPLGTYQISVAGMGSDMQYSDYSEPINITIN